MSLTNSQADALLAWLDGSRAVDLGYGPDDNPTRSELERAYSKLWAILEAKDRANVLSACQALLSGEALDGMRMLAKLSSFMTEGLKGSRDARMLLAMMSELGRTNKRGGTLSVYGPESLKGVTDRSERAKKERAKKFLELEISKLNEWIKSVLIELRKDAQSFYDEKVKESLVVATLDALKADQALRESIKSTWETRMKKRWDFKREKDIQRAELMREEIGIAIVLNDQPAQGDEVYIPPEEEYFLSIEYPEVPAAPAQVQEFSLSAYDYFTMIAAELKAMSEARQLAGTYWFTQGTWDDMMAIQSWDAFFEKFPSAAAMRNIFEQVAAVEGISPVTRLLGYILDDSWMTALAFPA